MAQNPEPPYQSQFWSRKNSFGLFVEGAPTSSHMLIGTTRQRVLLALGGAYSRRIFVTGPVAFSYNVEFRPVMMESDPVLRSLNSFLKGPVSFTPAMPVINPHNLIEDPNLVMYTIGGYNDAVFGRRWTYAGGLSPLGFQFHFLNRHRWQPELIGQAGFMVSPRDLPIFNSSQFNFTFQFGAGLEYYYANQRSLMFEYRYHHFSNDFTGTNNPGTDSGVYKLTYWFGH
ncbi:MAG TPA: acyloxyacyl hydrolase [Acidobacteriaceae bacterium]|nr:acyloxyacyl hydrolase [Acidobacteriaceae bacterium]